MTNDIVRVRSLNEGLGFIDDRVMEFGCIITDMYYPIEDGGNEAEFGLLLVDKLKEKEIDIPVYYLFK